MEVYATRNLGTLFQGARAFHVCKKQSKVVSLILTLLSSSTDALVFKSPKRIG